MAKLLNSYKFTVNKNGQSAEAIYPMLVGNPFSMQITFNNQSLTVVVKYNSITETPMLEISNETGSIQGQTLVVDWPTNLLCIENAGPYGLYFFEKEQEFRFYKLDKDWYNSTLDYYSTKAIIDARGFEESS